MNFYSLPLYVPQLLVFKSEKEVSCCVTNIYNLTQEKLVSESSRRLPEVVQQQFRGCGGARVPRQHAAGARSRVSRAHRQLARCHGW